MPAVTLTQVTDPACTWCWGAEPVLRRLEETYRDQVSFEFVTGGLVRDFETFHDAANGITAPADVAPHWETAAARHGMPVDADVWRVDPPRSTYPASVAYHAAKAQDPAAARRYLRRLREAVATERRNVARREVLVSLADGIGLDVDALVEALDDGSAREAFSADRAFARRHGATQFPSFRVSAAGGTRWLFGFQRFDALAAAIEDIAPGVTRHDPRPLVDFLRRRGRVATAEVAETYGLDAGKATETLRSLVEDGVLEVEKRGTGYVWTATGNYATETDPGEPGEDGLDAADSRESTGRSCGLDSECGPARE